MKEIGIIDLIYKIKNGEEVPSRIYFDDYNWEFIPYKNDYLRDINRINKDAYLFDWYLKGTSFERFVNYKAKIIEEDKEIEKIAIIIDEATPNSYYILNEHGTKCYLTKHSKIIADKVNLLIDKLNKLENK